MTVSCRYLIVGGGMAAGAAVRGIREVDSTGKIILLSADRHPPYARPPLSKKLWTGKPLESIFLGTEELGCDLRLETRAVSGDPSARTVRDQRGTVYSYEKLLLATGGATRRLPVRDDGVVYFRTLDDYERLRSVTSRPAHVVVIGGGFIGSEIAAALSTNGSAVSMIFPESGIGARVYTPGLSAFINAYYEQKGVTLLPGDTVSAVEASGQKFDVTTACGKALTCDAVVAGIGIEPDTSLAMALGLTVDNGIVVDESLRTSSPDIYAAGDVANFYSSALGVRRRVEHEDNAKTMGSVAGRNMAGASGEYDYLPYFYSDLFDLGYEAVGEISSDMDLVEDWTDRYRKGVVYHLREGKVRGVLLWNTWDRIALAREMIGAGETWSEDALKGRIS